jgi:predicted ATPase
MRSPQTNAAVHAMSNRKQRRSRRGLILSEIGFARVNRARRRLELDRNDGGRISLEQLSFDFGLSTKSMSRLFSRDVPVDRRTIELLFAGLGLTLHGDDVALPERAARPERSVLPRYRTMMFGRDAELARLEELGRARMFVTLTGPGGVGKTRLAVEWARTSGDAYAYCAYIDLSLFSDGTTLHDAIAAALDDGTARYEEVLLVLDGCEHLISEAAEAVTALLSTYAHLDVLATSREPLRIDGEVIIRVDPLGIPGAAPLTAAEALKFPAFAMFVERARSFDDRFSSGDDAVDLVAEVVRGLDGVPLSLELAAARAASMALADLRESLRDHLEALNEGPRTNVPRHRSARLLIDWSYALLTPEEGAVFRRLGVFMGTFGAAAVAAVCDDSAGTRAIVDVLTGLARKSLVIVDALGSTTRYHLLETVRQFAAEKLEERHETATAHQRHALYYFDVASRAATAIGRVGQGEVLNELQRDSANMREALEWSTGMSSNVYLGAALAAQLVEFWDARGDTAEGEHWLRRAAAAETHLMTDANRAKIQEGLALIAYRRGRLEECVAEAAAALALYAPLGDEAGKLRARNLLGLAAMDTGQIASAKEQFQANLAEGAEAADARAISSSLNNLGWLLVEHEGQTQSAIPLFKESLAVARDNGLLSLVVMALRNLAESAFELGHGSAALTYARLGVAEAEKLGNPEAAAALALQAVACVITAEGVEAARDESLGAWRTFVRAPYRAMIADGLDMIAIALVGIGQAQQAALLLGATMASRRQGGVTGSRRSIERHRTVETRVRSALPPGEADAIQTRGAMLSLDEALLEALIEPA